MSLPSYAVTFRGLPACPCLATWLPVYEAELQRRGLLTGPIKLYQLIGGAAASGGTHVDGGAFDTAFVGDEGVAVARQMGADATWHRRLGWDGHGGMEHVHGVLTGCPHNGPARYQIDAVKAGYNGLGFGGHAARDDGPRPLSGRTWQEGLTWARKQQEDDMPTPRDVWDEPLKAAADHNAGVALGQTWRMVQALQGEVAAVQSQLAEILAAVKGK
jgi:hypothetical protein